MLKYFRTSIIICLLFAGFSLAAEPVADATLTVLEELDKEYPSSVREFQKKMALKGDKGAQYALGNIYHYGVGVDVNLDEATIWYSMAAMSGHAGAINQLKFIEIKQQGFKDDQHAAWFDNLVNEADPSDETAVMIKEVVGIRKQSGASLGSDPVKTN